MKNLKWMFGFVMMSALFVGCDKSNNDSVVQNPTCAVGQYYSNGGCYNQNGYVNPAATTFPIGFYADNYTGTTRINVVNSAKMKELFKYGMGVCDRAANNYGQASCDYYLSGRMAIVIQLPTGPAASANSLLATLIAQPRQNQYVNYYAQLPSGSGLLSTALGYLTGIYLPDPKYYTGATRNPLQLQMTVSSINNSAGFEARGYGDYWTGYNTTLLAIQVPQGKVENSSFNFNFLVQGVNAAQGVMSRCSTPNCGL
ncbi:MAG: hypothetical protein H7256_16055 [Bdellovibrio sp.]|nr:hypothetical protein [Bdellovibrio sp.]